MTERQRKVCYLISYGHKVSSLNKMSDDELNKIFQEYMPVKKGCE